MRNDHCARSKFSIGVRVLCALFLSWIACASMRAQGGPPLITNDPGTPGPNSWEINVGLIPDLQQNQRSFHAPDLDINYGVGKRIQLTYEVAWLLETVDPNPMKAGLGQSQLGVKWRFLDNGEGRFQMSLFPQISINNPDRAVQRGLVPRGWSLILPIEMSKKLGPIDVDFEVGYNVNHFGPNGWITGLALGHQMTKRLELIGELYSLGTVDGAMHQETWDFGGRYTLHPSFILLFMSGRSFSGPSSGQPQYIGYFGMQFLFPPPKD